MKLLKNKLVVTIIVLSVCFLALISYTSQRSGLFSIEGGFGSGINVVQGEVYKVLNKAKSAFSFLASISNLKQENRQLKAENDELRQYELEFNIAQKENQTLSQMLNYKNQRNEYKYITCDLIGKAGGSYLDEFTINRGESDGILKGMVVITNDGLVGQITSVAKNWSLFETLSSQNIAVHGVMENTEEVNGIVKGYSENDNKFLAKMYNLPQDSKINKGDVVLTSGLGGLYPKGIKIGTVLSTENDQGRLMKNAVLKPAVDLSKLQVVMVVVPKVINKLPNDKIEITY